MKRALIIIGVCLPLSLLAEVTLKIRGRVVDGTTHRALSESHVYIDEQNGVLTDNEGYFNLDVPNTLLSGNINVSYMGYSTFSMPLSEVEGDVLNIGLVQNMILMNEMVVYSDKWLLVEETLVDLAEQYENKELFYNELLARIKTMDEKLPEVKHAGIGSGSWPLIIISGLILIIWGIICKPLFKNLTKSKTKPSD